MTPELQGILNVLPLYTNRKVKVHIQTATSGGRPYEFSGHQGADYTVITNYYVQDGDLILLAGSNNYTVEVRLLQAHTIENDVLSIYTSDWTRVTIEYYNGK